jgi:hypothetical protein
MEAQNMQAYLSELVSYLIKVVIMLAAAGAGVKFGIKLRKNKSK